MGAYHSIHNWLVVALVVAVMVRARNFKFRSYDACVVCGQVDGHTPGCPGRRGN